MQKVSARIWTRVVVSISYDNHYTTGFVLHINLWQASEGFPKQDVQLCLT